MSKLERHMMRIFSLEFWSYAGERAIKTVAQSAIAVLGTGSIGLFAIDWVSLASVSLGAGLLSILTSVAFKKD
jgi:threonine dehydrogenase-like Zn-dependent dehydrogenase